MEVWAVYCSFPWQCYSRVRWKTCCISCFSCLKSWLKVLHYWDLIVELEISWWWMYDVQACFAWSYHNLKKAIHVIIPQSAISFISTLLILVFTLIHCWPTFYLPLFVDVIVLYVYFWKCTKVRNTCKMRVQRVFTLFCSCCSNSKNVNLYILSNVAEFDDYAEIVDDDPDYAHPMAGRLTNLVKLLCCCIMKLRSVKLFLNRQHW